MAKCASPSASSSRKSARPDVCHDLQFTFSSDAEKCSVLSQLDWVKKLLIPDEVKAVNNLQLVNGILDRINEAAATRFDKAILGDETVQTLGSVSMLDSSGQCKH